MFGFTGREHELESGLVYARARYLQPAVARWTGNDPLGFVDGPATYAYARNSPTRYVDPFGESAIQIAFPWSNIIFAVVGAVVGGVWGYAQATAAGLSGGEFAAVVIANAVAGALSAVFGVPHGIGGEAGPLLAGFINGAFMAASTLFGQVAHVAATKGLWNLRPSDIDWISIFVSFMAGFASGGSAWAFFGRDSLWTAALGQKFMTIAGVLGIIAGSWNGIVEVQRAYYLRQQAMLAQTEEDGLGMLCLQAG